MGAARDPPRDFLCGAGAGAPRLMLTSWKALLDRMQAKVAAVADSQAEADIRQLRGLADREEEDVFLPLRSEELRPDFLRLVLLLLQPLVDSAIEHAKGAGWVKKPKKKPLSWGYGQYLRLAGVEVWFGIHFDRWARLSTAPLWLCFSNDSLQEREKTRSELEPLRRKNPRELFDDDVGGLLVPVALPVEVGYERLETVVTRLERGEELSNAEVLKYDAVMEPVLEPVVTRLEEVAQLLGATSRQRGKKRTAPPRGLVDPGESPSLQRKGMRPDFPRRVRWLRRLVDDATVRARTAGWVDTKGLLAAAQSWGYGRFLRLAGAQVWFGIDFESWARLPPATPLWLWFTPNSLRRREETRGTLEPLQRKNPCELFDGQNGLVVPVLLPLEKDYDAVLADVVKRLEEVAQLIGRTGGHR